MRHNQIRDSRMKRFSRLPGYDMAGAYDAPSGGAMALETKVARATQLTQHGVDAVAAKIAATLQIRG